MACCFRPKALPDPSKETDVHVVAEGSPVPRNLKHEVLIQIPGCSVHLMNDGEAHELAQGEFMIIQVLDENVSLATIIKLDNIQWPLTKDEPVVKLDALNYLFTLPMKDGEPLNYGVTFTEHSNGGLDSLDSFLKEHSCFSGLKLSKEKEGLDWKEFAPRVDNYNSFLAKAIAGGTGQIVKGIFICSNAYSNKVRQGGETILSSGADGENGATPKEKRSKKKKSSLNKNLNRVRRMSKITEKLSKTVLNGIGLISGKVMSPVVNSQAGKKILKMLPGEVILASLDAVNKLLDAAEAAEKQTFSATSEATTRMVTNRFGENAGEATEHMLATAGHAAGAAWNVFKIRNVINPTASASTTARVLANVSVTTDAVRSAAKKNIKA